MKDNDLGRRASAEPALAVPVETRSTAGFATTGFDQAQFAPCPTCKQYDHSIHGDSLAEAFMHFEAMYSHRGDGIPTQFRFDQRTRDMAQVLVAAARGKKEA